MIKQLRRSKTVHTTNWAERPLFVHKLGVKWRILGQKWIKILNGFRFRIGCKNGFWSIPKWIKNHTMYQSPQNVWKFNFEGIASKLNFEQKHISTPSVLRKLQGSRVQKWHHYGISSLLTSLQIMPWVASLQSHLFHTSSWRHHKNYFKGKYFVPCALLYRFCRGYE